MLVVDRLYSPSGPSTQGGGVQKIGTDDSSGNLVIADTIYQAETGYGLVEPADGSIFIMVEVSYLDENGGLGITYFTQKKLDPNAEYTFANPPGYFVGYGWDGATDEAQKYADIVPCFTAGSMIEIEADMVAIASVRVGDKVKTLEDGMKEVQWVGSRRLSRAELEGCQKHAHISITAF